MYSNGGRKLLMSLHRCGFLSRNSFQTFLKHFSSPQVHETPADGLNLREGSAYRPMPSDYAWQQASAALENNRCCDFVCQHSRLDRISNFESPVCLLRVPCMSL